MNIHDQKLQQFLMTNFPDKSITLSYEELKQMIDQQLIVTSSYLYEKLFFDFEKGQQYITKLGFHFTKSEKIAAEESVENTGKSQDETIMDDTEPEFDLTAALLAEDYVAEDSADFIHSEEFRENFEKHDVITFEKNDEYFEQYALDSDEETLEKIVLANQKLVNKMALKYYNVMPKGGLELDDIVSFGQKGLLRAIEKYDSSKGFKFSTYATHWIKQSITRGFADESRIIRLPVHLNEALNKIRQIIRQKDYESPQQMIEDIKRNSDFSEGQIENLLLYDHLYNQAQVSLSTYVGEDKDSTIGDFIVEPIEVNQSMFGNDLVENEAFKNELNRYINKLIEKECKPREADVIIKRFGLNGLEVMTLEEIGLDHGVTRERIRQIEAKALRKLSKHKAKLNLKDYWEAH
ncbi:sigma-70 family RNA polymerase sigma factor [Macrococcus equipercicus]|uniref:Sigma-70 family RNA polymerase sigma factor n=1 Tax=Macrococcus equipercicus TaxID=69967 RepID=A0ABQ6R6H1_9STAP|nr:RNA polymerase sigma factor RpoD/SigA [Macrococcus equipercicus]KAA1036893.1 sigma-70 family RNA polymerase sigma factor [Macrococcus equipercicus]